MNGSIPSSSAVSLGSTGCGVPPSAAAPSGETFAASLAAPNLRRSRRNASKWASRWWEAGSAARAEDGCIRVERGPRSSRPPRRAPASRRVCPNRSVLPRPWRRGADRGPPDRCGCGRYAAGATSPTSSFSLRSTAVCILVREIPRELPRLYLLQHRLEAPHQRRRLSIRDDSLHPQHPRVGDGAAYIVGSETDVEGDGGIETLESLCR